MKIIFPVDHLMTRLFTPFLTQKYEDLYRVYGVKFVKVGAISPLQSAPHPTQTERTLKEKSGNRVKRVIKIEIYLFI